MTSVHIEETGDWVSGEWVPSGFNAYIGGQEDGPVTHGDDETAALAELANDCLIRGSSEVYTVLAKMMEIAIAPGTDFHRQGLTKAARILRSMA
ncbi:MAG: hypothetical protein VKL39_24500 [Leptolyngbyaceae bacterium]|nr:hypothetical protein [Leptolyngbyaceae bacterium]